MKHLMWCHWILMLSQEVHCQPDLLQRYIQWHILRCFVQAAAKKLSYSPNALYCHRLLVYYFHAPMHAWSLLLHTGDPSGELLQWSRAGALRRGETASDGGARCVEGNTHPAEPTARLWYSSHLSDNNQCIAFTPWASWSLSLSLHPVRVYF